MVELVDRFYRPAVRNQDISIERFVAGANLLALGIITKPQLVTTLGLDAESETQLDQLINHYTALTANEKREFYGKLRSLLVLLSTGDLTKTQFKTLLNIT